MSASENRVCTAFNTKSQSESCNSATTGSRFERDARQRALQSLRLARRPLASGEKALRLSYHEGQELQLPFVEAEERARRGPQQSRSVDWATATAQVCDA
jgi:hypothetical protein